MNGNCPPCRYARDDAAPQFRSSMFDGRENHRPEDPSLQVRSAHCRCTKSWRNPLFLPHRRSPALTPVYLSRTDHCRYTVGSASCLGNPTIPRSDLPPHRRCPSPPLRDSLSLPKPFVSQRRNLTYTLSAIGVLGGGQRLSSSFSSRKNLVSVYRRGALFGFTHSLASGSLRETG